MEGWEDSYANDDLMNVTGYEASERVVAHSSMRKKVLLHGDGRSKH